jgi:hypothetical protein
MSDRKEIIIRPVEDELQACPECGYDRGFHVSFIKAGPGSGNPVRSTREVFRVILNCPECGARYDVGWRVPLSEFESRFVKAPLQSTCVPHGNPAECLPALPPHDKRPTG